jgi:hypothetical protein
MANGSRMQHGSTVGAIVLITVGGLFLYANLNPDFSPWPLVARYWPVLLILWGLFKMVNFVRFRNDPGAVSKTRLTGGEIFSLIFLLILGSLFSTTYRQAKEWKTSVTPGEFHQAETIELGEAETVEARLELTHGSLRLAGDATQLLEADFDYDVKEWKPRVSYNVLDKKGKLVLRQEVESAIAFGDRRNRWDLKFNNDVPLELDINIGAGQSFLELGGMNLSRVKFNVGAGEVEADLRGEWKQDASVDIEGGVGHAKIRLPQEVGVRVEASGGLGSIDVRGLKKRGRGYVNDAYGKSPVTLRIEVTGGIGAIEIEG